ncbi:MAG: TatD family hydrolase [Candidatus Pacearchaeota archaeon]|jgi:TatD DNase family protein
MVFIDVHCHIDRYSDEEIVEIIGRAKKEGVGIMINNGNTVEADRKNLELAGMYPQVKAALGIHPIDYNLYTDEEIKEEIRFIKKNKEKIVAVGEVGFDLKEAVVDFDRQKKVFFEWMKLASEIDKPIIIHSRKAEKEAVEIVDEFAKNHKIKVLMHCFSGNMKLVDKIRDNGWFFSIPASIKHSTHFQEVVKRVPISQLFCETDSPFLHPDKERNNEPALVIEAYKKISEIKGISLNEVEKQIEENYRKFFNDR